MPNPPLQPITRVLVALQEHGERWQDVHADLSKPEVVSPDAHHPGRMQIFGDKFMGIVCPTVRDEEDVWVLICARPRTRASEPSPVQVVGIEPKRRHRRHKGGSGGHWPSTWEDLLKRVEQRAGWAIAPTGGGHIVVLHNGKQMTSIPSTPSEYRGLMNACLQIKRAGLDLREAG